MQTKALPNESRGPKVPIEMDFTCTSLAFIFRGNALDSTFKFCFQCISFIMCFTINHNKVNSVFGYIGLRQKMPKRRNLNPKQDAEFHIETRKDKGGLDGKYISDFKGKLHLLMNVI